MTHETGAIREALAPRSRFYQGPFGRIFSDLEPWRPSGVTDDNLANFLLDFANKSMLEHPPEVGLPIPLPGSLDEPEHLGGLDSPIPAGYTYLGQFVDHDITFDPTSSLQRQNDPNSLVNFRTPRLDLDCVYGRGPQDQPYLYDSDTTVPKGSFLIGTSTDSQLRDLPRNAQGRALIGDMRNDENAIVSQLHLAFLLAHNTLLKRAEEKGLTHPFDAARTTLRWLYQWIVWHDFVHRVTDPAIHAQALRKTTSPDGRTVWARCQQDVYAWHDQPFMPVEFSVAAYRFGHSMVRNKYQTNHPHRGAGIFAPIFDNTGDPTVDDLRGFRPLLSANAIQWDWYLQMRSSGGKFPQMARKIDTELANALAFLHEGPAGSPMNVLAARNLLRGVRMGLPSGPDVARKLGIPPLALAASEPEALWFYILKEAEALTAGQHLGPVGSIIVTAVFSGLLEGDPSSWININPGWTPETDPLLKPTDDNKDAPPDWTLASIIRLAGLPVNASEVSAQS